MQLTNRFKLPEILVRALTPRPRIILPNHFAVTGLLDPPQKRELETVHDAEVMEDISERCWVLFGSGIHAALEEHGEKTPNYKAELKLEAPIPELEMNLIGIADGLDLDFGTLWDYKVVSVWSFILGDKPDWERQLNMLAWLARRNNIKDIKRLCILAILRDWSERKAAEDSDYPKCPLHVKQVPMWTDEQATSYIVNRAKLHLVTRGKDRKELPPCTSEERWERPTTWAVMRDGRKSAVKVCPTENEAKLILSALDAKRHRIVRRQGECVRCRSYCNAAKWCWQLERETDPTANWGDEEAALDAMRPQSAEGDNGKE